jgi:hypothetical protein
LCSCVPALSVSNDAMYATIIPTVSPWPSALSVCWSSSCPPGFCVYPVFRAFLSLLPPARFLCGHVFVLYVQPLGDADHSYRQPLPVMQCSARFDTLNY